MRKSRAGSLALRLSTTKGLISSLTQREIPVRERGSLYQSAAMSSTVPPSESSSVRAFQPGASQAELWHSMLTDPQLQDLPFKIETNERGQLVLSPDKRIHSIRQTQITDRLAEGIGRPGIRSVPQRRTGDWHGRGRESGRRRVVSSERFAEINPEAERPPSRLNCM